MPKEVKNERLSRLFAAQDPVTEEVSRGYLGRQVEVLFEKEHQPGVLEGRAPTNKIVRVKGEKRHLGEILSVKITNTSMYILKGDIGTEVRH